MNVTLGARLQLPAGWSRSLRPWTQVELLGDMTNPRMMIQAQEREVVRGTERWRKKNIKVQEERTCREEVVVWSKKAKSHHSNFLLFFLMHKLCIVSCFGSFA